MTRDPFWAYGTDDDFVDNAQMFAWHDAVCALVPVNGGIRAKHEPAPIIANIARFLQRGDPIKPTLARIIGRLLAGEEFFSMPQNLPLPEQFNDEGIVIWNANKPPTQATVEAFTFRLVNGKVTRKAKGKPFQPFRAGAIWRAAEMARADIAAGKARNLAIADAAREERVTVVEVRRQLQFDSVKHKRQLPPITFKKNLIAGN
jgi:hypothetical protein